MGLDITAYRGLTEAKGNEAFDDEGEVRYEDGWFRVFVDNAFPGRADDLKDRHAYKAAESFGFYAGSYGGYSRWREELAELAGYPMAAVIESGDVLDMAYRKHHPHAAAAWNEGAESLPFYELVNFTDCDGVLGTACCKKLSADFVAFQAKAEAHPDLHFRQLYTEWQTAFALASDNGCVVFH